MPVVAAGLACFGLLACSLYFGPAPEQNSSWLLVALLAVGFELKSVRLPHFGLLSAAGTIYLAGILAPSVGPIPVAHLVLLGVGLRTVLRPTKRQGVAAEAVSDMLAVLTVAAAVSLFPARTPFLVSSLMAVVIYFLVANLGTRILLPPGTDIQDWRAMTEALALHRLGFLALAPLLALSIDQHPWAGLWMLLVAPGIHAAIEATLTRLDIKHRIRLSHQEEELQEELAKAESVKRELYEDIRRRLDEKVLIEDLTRAFATSPGLEKVLDSAIAMIRQIVPCRSVVFFFPQQGKLFPRRWDSPDSKRLEDHLLLDLSEPLAQRCWSDSKLVLLTKEAASQPRLLEAEDQAAALPLHGKGVLYVGRDTGEPFSRDHLYQLALIGDHVSPAIVSSHRYQSLQEALTAHSTANSHLKDWNHRLGVMLEGFWGMASSLSSEHIQERLVALLQSLVPHQAGLVLLQEGAQSKAWPASGWNREACDEIAKVVAENDRPLLLEAVHTSRFCSPFQDHQSVLASPLSHAGQRLGTLILCAQEPKQFERSHQDLLTMVGLHTSALSANARLYDEVVEAHKALETSQVQLAQSSKLAAVGQLAAGVAHEINSPLGAILLEVQSALRNLKKERVGKAQEKLEVAQGAARSAKDIIAKLLFYARQAPDEQRPVNLNEVVRDSLSFMSSQMEQDGAQIDTDLVQDLPTIAGNHNQVQQIVTALMLNAKDAALMESASSTLVTLATRVEQDAVILSVKDRGPGIPPEVQSKIFDPFFTTKEVGQGTGLGLSVTQQLVDKHQGEIRFTSGPEGTCFEVLFPFLKTK